MHIILFVCVLRHVFDSLSLRVLFSNADQLLYIHMLAYQGGVVAIVTLWKTTLHCAMFVHSIHAIGLDVPSEALIACKMEGSTLETMCSFLTTHTTLMLLWSDALLAFPAPFIPGKLVIPALCAFPIALGCPLAFLGTTMAFASTRKVFMST
jgi:hypothetical protein